MVPFTGPVHAQRTKPGSKAVVVRCHNPAIAHSANVWDCLIWAAIALIVQIIVYYLVRVPVPNLSQRIASGELAAAMQDAGLRGVAVALIDRKGRCKGAVGTTMPMTAYLNSEHMLEAVLPPLQEVAQGMRPLL